MPSTENFRLFQAAINDRYPTLQDVYAVPGALKLQLEESIDTIAQETFYNWRTHDRYVGKLFDFAPSKVAIAFTVNALGSMHDSCIAEWGSVYDILETIYERMVDRIVVDFAFSPRENSFLINSV